MTRRAFTLIEVLLAIALIAVLSGSMFAYIHNLLGRRDRLVEVASQQSAAGVLIEQLEHDLSMTFAVDGSGAAGVKGTATEITVRCRGVSTGGGSVDLGDLQGSGFEYEASGKSLSGHRIGKSDESTERLASKLEAVRFRYFDGTQWHAEFDSAAAGELPVAVEVAMWFDTGAAEAAPAVDAKGSDATDEEESKAPSRVPDRVRVMVVPDGPAASGKSSL